MIVISTMDKLPESCGECPLFNQDAMRCCAASRDRNECPLVELSDAASVETNIYDEVEEIPNCVVQVLHNTFTDEYSVAWWRMDNPPPVFSPEREETD